MKKISQVVLLITVALVGCSRNDSKSNQTKIAFDTKGNVAALQTFPLTIHFEGSIAFVAEGVVATPTAAWGLAVNAESPLDHFNDPLDAHYAALRIDGAYLVPTPTPADGSVLSLSRLIGEEVSLPANCTATCDPMHSFCFDSSRSYLPVLDNYSSGFGYVDKAAIGPIASVPPKMISGRILVNQGVLKFDQVITDITGVPIEWCIKNATSPCVLASDKHQQIAQHAEVSYDCSGTSAKLKITKFGSAADRYVTVYPQQTGGANKITVEFLDLTGEDLAISGQAKIPSLDIPHFKRFYDLSDKLGSLTRPFYCFPKQDHPSAGGKPYCTFAELLLH